MQVVPRILDFVSEDFLHVLDAVRDDAGRLVLGEEHLVEIENREERRHTELTRFRNDGEEPEVVMDVLLHGIHLEEHLVSVLILDVVQVIQAPLPILEVRFDICECRSRIRHDLAHLYVGFLHISFLRPHRLRPI